MGGIVGLTIRFNEKRTYRGSCWTNVLPNGLFAAPFYLGEDASQRHVAAWLDRIVENREANPDVGKVWAGWDKLAPVEYGLIVIDYLTSTLVSAQGHCSVTRVDSYTSGPRAKKDPVKAVKCAVDAPASAPAWYRDPIITLLDAMEPEEEKYDVLDRMGLLTPCEGSPIAKRSATIKCPFETVAEGFEDAADEQLQTWCEANFGLSRAERRAWAKWFKRMEE